MDDIAPFLPKYPNIDVKPQPSLNPYNGNFNQEIYLKKEFYDERLPEIEIPSTEPGTLLKHQRIIARFLSSHTLYDGILLLHQPGTGKTCASVGAIEQIRSEGIGFRGALVFVKGPDLKNTFKDEIVKKCTSGQYIPEGASLVNGKLDRGELTTGELIRRTNMLLKQYYSFDTLQTFSKRLRSMTDDEIKSNYSNHIIVIDEVHNLRIKDKTGKTPYDAFWRLIHVAEGCKVLLMSGTPMKDRVEEVAAIMNLILPVDQQLPTGETFLRKFFDSDYSGVITETGEPFPFQIVKPSMIKKLKLSFKGRVSYLRLSHSAVPQIFMGTDPATRPDMNLRHFRVVESAMSEFQTQGYSRALLADASQKDFFSHARQASLFVYPDGSYGEAGFKKYIESSSKGGLRSKLKKMEANPEARYGDTVGTIKKFSSTKDFKKAIYANGKSQDEMLATIGTYSRKYADTISQLLEARENRKSSFVYSSLVQGSGLIVFAELLTMFGFGKATGNEPDDDEKPRFALITSSTASSTDLNALMSRFNQYDNRHGQIISVILGSPKVSEGFTFKNVQSETILTPFWNYSETAQVLARGYRVGSHAALGDNATLEIYQRVSIPDSEMFCIDLYEYQLSEVKDVSIKGVERVMKESAFDCALTYKRNYVKGFDGERLCDYTGCEYMCDGIDPNLLEDDGVTPNMLDYSTYELYYSSEQINKISDLVIHLFRDSFNLSLEVITNEIVSKLSTATPFQIMTALRRIIHDNVVIHDRYGLAAYLREQNNAYFLVGSLSVTGNTASQYYTSDPIHVTTITFKEILAQMQSQSIRSVERACNSTTTTELATYVSVLPLRVQEIVIEACISSKELGLKVNTTFRDLALKCYEGAYEKIGKNWISHLLYESDGILRCFDGTTWTNCDTASTTKYLKKKEAFEHKMANSPYKHYGIVSEREGKRVFKIKDVSANELSKKHKTSGKVCSTWNVGLLINLVIDSLKIPPPSDYLPTATKKVLWNSININKYKRAPIENMSLEDTRRASYWTSQIAARQKVPLCQAILDWFDKTGYLQKAPGCSAVEV